MKKEKKPKGFSFIDDEEKMEDFYLLSKEEFLQSYSYLHEDDYDATMEEVLLKNLREVQK